MTSDRRHEVTAILHGLAHGTAADPAAADRLLRMVYDELRVLAGSLMQRERVDHTLQPTILVHEAWLKLADVSGVDWQGRAHFYGIAARVMRRLLIDHARKHNAERRGGGAWARVSLSEAGAAAGATPEADFELLAVHEALERFAALDARAAQVVEMRVFAGLTVDEVAAVLGVSPRTVDGDWAVARRWLRRELADCR